MSLHPTTIIVTGRLAGRTVRATWADGHLEGDDALIDHAVLARRTTRAGRNGTVLDDIASALDALLAALDGLVDVQVGGLAPTDHLDEAVAAYAAALERNQVAIDAGQRPPMGAGAVGVLRHRLVTAIARHQAGAAQPA